MTLLDLLPVWWEAVLLFGAMLAACELAGLLPGTQRSGEGGKEAYLVSAAIGLLALLLGFTFNLALSHYDLRRTLVVQEGAAITEVARRLDLLPPPVRAAARASLVRYAQDRVALAEAGEDAAAITRVEAATQTEQRRLWATIEPTIVGRGTGNLLVQPLDTMFGITVSRRAALASRIPSQVVWVLGLYSLISASILGYAIAFGDLRHRWATTALFMLLAITVGLILDLDRPRDGFIHIDQQPLRDALTGLPAA